MGYHGNDAFLHSTNQNYLGNSFFRIQGVQMNNVVPLKNSPVGGARKVQIVHGYIPRGCNLEPF